MAEVGDLGNFVDQFGVTTSLEEGFGWAVLNESWNAFTSPFETWHRFSFTFDALDAYDDLLANNGQDLVDMGDALTHAVGSLNSLSAAIERADLDDPTSRLGGKGADVLREVLDGYQSTFDNASPEWQDRHADALNDYRSHIELKLSDSRAALQSLQDSLPRLDQMRDWLEDLRRLPDGSLRPGTAWFNPELMVRLGAVNVALGALGSDVFLGNRPPESAEAPGDIPDPFADLDNGPIDWDMSEEELEALYAAEDPFAAGDIPGMDR